MDRLVALQPFGDRVGYLAHVIKECDDWDDEAHDDSTYRADFSDTPRGEPEPSALLLRDLAELNVALREAARAYADPSVFSAIEKIEAAISDVIQVDSVTDEPFLGAVRDAVEGHLQLKVEYASGLGGESQERWIEPREVRVLNGRALTRAWCATREGWRTFRVDRIVRVLATSPATQARPAGPGRQLADPRRRGGRGGRRGRRAVAALALRAAAERALGGARRRPPAVSIRVSDPAFLDHLMLQAGAGAVVATPAYAKAGHALARRIAERL